MNACFLHSFLSPTPHSPPTCTGSDFDTHQCLPYPTTPHYNQQIRETQHQRYNTQTLERTASTYPFKRYSTTLSNTFKSPKKIALRAAVITGIGRFRDEDGCEEGITSHRKAAELRLGLGPGNPLFIMSSVYNPLPLSPLLMWMCACDLCHLCPLLLHVPVFPTPSIHNRHDKRNRLRELYTTVPQSPFTSTPNPHFKLWTYLHIEKKSPCGRQPKHLSLLPPPTSQIAIWWVS
jgi:hypothetical protein